MRQGSPPDHVPAQVAPGASSQTARALDVAAPIALGFLVFALYFLAYRVRGEVVPVGFDTPWYVWRAEFVAEEGVGPLATALRPGHALLSAVLGALAGRTQLELAAVLPLALAGAFALAVGALGAEALGRGRAGWAVAVLVAGGLLGATRLVGENVANLLNLTAAVAGAWFLLPGRWRGPLPVGAALLLVGAGLAHWLFLAVELAVLGAWAVLALPSSARSRRAGTPLVRTESGGIAAASLASAVVVGATSLALHKGELRAIEVQEDQGRFLPKLRTDLLRLAWPVTAPVAVGGVALLGAEAARGAGARGSREDGHGIRSAALRALAAWAGVAVAGLAVGAVTEVLPPHRFLSLVVAVPGVVAVAAAVAGAAGWIAGRTRRWIGVAFAAAAVAGVAAPGVMAWYGGGPGVWIQERALRQATAAAGYLERLPPGTPVVFLLGPFGPAGVVSPALKERTVRVGLPAERQGDVHFVFGDLEDLLAGRRTLVPSEGLNRATLPYWEQARPALPSDPPVVVLSALAGEAHRSAMTKPGAQVIAPGVAVLRGPPAPTSASLPPAPRSVPGTAAGLGWGVLLLVALVAAGGGWASALACRTAPRLLVWSVAPAVGCSVLMGAGLAVSAAGAGLGGVVGVAVYAVVTAGGWATALVARSPGWRQSRRGKTGEPRSTQPASRAPR